MIIVTKDGTFQVQEIKCHCGQTVKEEDLIETPYGWLGHKGCPWQLLSFRVKAKVENR